MENSSSWHRVAPTAMVWQLLAGLMFLSALAGALYARHPDRRTLCAGGLAAFALCLCWELPTVLQTLVQEGGGALLSPTLLFSWRLCCVGALGAFSPLTAFTQGLSRVHRKSAAAWLNCSKQHPIPRGK